ncbi:leptin receptor gene-related protein-like [Anneissia japonica]|uniref:leptin receptor gene-related protein-like n=1 Tax=Anneissia japonica TaxID=1529436 RepID=UPI0014257E97|nr:leptin receptor gene-related protein-like [Anneissia japonica]
MADDDDYAGYRLILLSFSASIGLLLVVLACALQAFGTWWPMFVLVFYVISPMPMWIASRLKESDYGSSGASSALHEICLFLTTGIVVSAYGLPFVLAHSGVIKWGAMGMVLFGNTWCFLTILAFFMIFYRNEDIEFMVW